MGKRAQRQQAAYDRLKAKARRGEELRQEEIDEAFAADGKLTKRQLNLLGYRRNWRGKWVPK